MTAAEPTPVTPSTIEARRACYATLSPREREVGLRLALGFSCREISAELRMSQKTAESHRSAVLAKLHLRNVADLARDAIRTGFVPPPDETTP